MCDTKVVWRSISCGAVISIDVQVLSGCPLSLHDEADAQLCVGALIVNDIRRKIHTSLHFTVSAGVAHSKMFAKVASAKHKPNKQVS